VPRHVFLLSMLTIAFSADLVFAQAPPPTPSRGPAFDVVSIKTVPAGTFPTPMRIRPDGSLSFSGSAATLIRLAYPPGDGPSEIVGLPDWVTRERYAVEATASLPKVTRDEMAAMLRAMLADRFKLSAHVEQRDTAAYDLLLARSDGRLGPGITPIEADCAAKIAADRAAAEATFSAGTPPTRPEPPDLNAPPPPCTLRSVGDRQGKVDRLEGEAPMSSLAMILRFPVGRFVVDKTGLTGSYRLRMLFNMRASQRGPEVAETDPDAAPSVFTAIREQMGLKLESSKAVGDVVVIDRLEPPTEN